MYPKGIIYNIYSSDKSGLHGTALLHANLAMKALYTLLRGIGAGLIGFAIIAGLFTFGPLIKDEVNYNLGLNKIDYQPARADLINAQSTSIIQEEARKFGVDSYFSIVIPKINAKANIIANVDPTNEKEYDQALSQGVAHAKGTYFPGQGKNIFLFSHSTNSLFNVSRYNAIFYLLHQMQKGDEIVIYFADRRYVYKVTETKIVGPKDVGVINGEGLMNQTPTETLVLQTCYPPGTSWNRLLVFAKLVDK